MKVDKLHKTADYIIMVDFIKNLVCDYYSENIELISQKNRKREVVKCRQISMYLLVRNTTMPLSEIAKYFNKDHATVIHSRKMIENYLTWDKDICKEISDLQIVVTEKLKKFTKGDYEEKGFYFIDLDNCSSIQIDNEKSILMTGFTDEEKTDFVKLLGLNIKVMEHKNTHLYILQKNEKD